MSNPLQSSVPSSLPPMDDSPLSTSASIAGLLTLAFALAAATYVRLTYLRRASTEYFAVKSSLQWYKTESEWINDLIPRPQHAGTRSPLPMSKEYVMYALVVEQLSKLEERLLDLVGVVEGEGEGEGEKGWERGGWALVPRVWGVGVAVKWVSVRTEALELVRQRDGLGSRVLFAQLALLSSRVLELEGQVRKGDEGLRRRLDVLEDLMREEVEERCR